MDDEDRTELMEDIRRMRATLKQAYRHLKDRDLHPTWSCLDEVASDARAAADGLRHSAHRGVRQRR